MSKSVKAALVANGLIAIAKGISAFFTGSASIQQYK
jgi:divalent metal cation (Fe/Co/Zn/Cd) transporter